MTDMRDIEDRLRKWHGLYFAEAGPEEPMMMEFLRDVHLAADALSAARKREEELSKLVHMPGMWHCAKCNFTLMQSNLNALDGSITARDNPGDKCPNDGSPLWRVSYRQAYKEMMEIAEQAQVRHRAREEELTAVVAGMVTSVGTIMQDTWNDFCSDTGCHPDDITHEGKKLFFHPAHWARAITEHLAALAPERAKAVLAVVEAARVAAKRHPEDHYHAGNCDLCAVRDAIAQLDGGAGGV